MRFDITKILFLLFIIVFQTPASAQETERDVCKQTRFSDYVIGFGTYHQSDSNSDINQAKAEAKMLARQEFAESMVTFVQSNTELNYTSTTVNDHENDHEIFHMASQFETRWKLDGVATIGPFECPEGSGRWIASAIKKAEDVYTNIEVSNGEKYQKATEYLQLSKNSTSYDEKIRNIFYAFIYNQSQFKTTYKRKPIYVDIYTDIEQEVREISKALEIDVKYPDKLSFDGKLGGNIIITVIPTGDMDIEEQPTMRLRADLVKGLVNTSEGHWDKNRTASIPIKLGEGFLRIDKVLSPQHVEILIQLDLDQYNPTDYDIDELGYSRINRIYPSEVFANYFKNIQKEVKISISSKTMDKKSQRGKIYISTPGYAKPLEVKINNDVKGQTKNASFETDELGFSYYTIELYAPQSSQKKIVPIKEVIKLNSKEEYLEIQEIKRKISSIDFIPVDKDASIRIHLKGKENGVDTKIYYEVGTVDGERLDKKYIDYSSDHPNTFHLNSGVYDILLTKEGEQTTKIKNNLSYGIPPRKIDLRIKKIKFPDNRKMLEYVPFVKPYICNESPREKLIKTSVLVLMTYFTAASYSNYVDKQDIYFSHKNQYEELRDVQQSVFDDKRSEMESAHNEFSSAFSTLNYLYAGLGITYGYTIFF